VKERLLLDGIALHAGRVSPWNVELAVAIEADFTHTRLTLGNGAAMATGKAAYAISIKILAQSWIGFANVLVEDLPESGHALLPF
jgi:hypothetical protein